MKAYECVCGLHGMQGLLRVLLLVPVYVRSCKSNNQGFIGPELFKDAYCLMTSPGMKCQEQITVLTFVLCNNRYTVPCLHKEPLPTLSCRPVAGFGALAGRRYYSDIHSLI